MSEKLTIANPEDGNRPLSYQALSHGIDELRLGDMGITDAVSCTRGKQREAVRFGTVHALRGKEKAHAATWAKQNSYRRKDTTMSAMIPPDIVQDGVAYWKADKVSAYFGGSPTVGTLGVWRYRGEGPKFVKLGGKREHRKRDTRRVAYPVREVIAWGEQNGLQQQTVAA